MARLRSKREPRKSNPVFSAQHPRGNLLNPRFDALIEGSATGCSCQHMPHLGYTPHAL